MISNDYPRMLQEKRMTLIMSLPVNDPDMCRAAFDAGADVVKCHVNLTHRASGNSFGTLSEMRPVLAEMLKERRGPMGIVLGNDPEKVEQDLEAALTLPFSFYSLYAHHVPPCLPGRGPALMAACDATYTMEEIEAMPGCGADILEASIVPGSEYGTRLTMRDLLRYSAIVRRVNVPVVVPTQRKILPEDVPALSRTGIRGLMIGAIVTGRDTDSVVRAIRAFRKAIDDLDSRD